MSSSEAAVTPSRLKVINSTGDVELMSGEDFETEFHCPYSETVDFPEALEAVRFKESIMSDIPPENLKRQLREILIHPREDLATRKIDDQVGYGLVALRPIPKATVLCFYSGSWRTGDKVTSAEDYGINYYESEYSVSTARHRGIASFCQHLPSMKIFPDLKTLQRVLAMTGQVVSEEQLKLNDEMYSISFEDRAMAAQVATENLQLEYVIFDGKPWILLVTKQNVAAGELLGFNYGYQYWLSRQRVPELFDKTGKVIPESAYQRTFGRLYFEGFNYQGDFKPLIDQIRAGNDVIHLNDTRRQERHVPSSIVLEALRRAHACSDSVCGPELLALLPLIGKYKIQNSSQSSLEQGLRRAAFLGNTADLALLVRNVKNINAKDDKKGLTALVWAQAKHHTECEEILRAHGAIDLEASEEPATHLG